MEERFFGTIREQTVGGGGQGKIGNMEEQGGMMVSG